MERKIRSGEVVFRNGKFIYENNENDEEREASVNGSDDGDNSDLEEEKEGEHEKMSE